MKTPLVRTIGWASVGVSVVALLAPGALGRALGVGERRALVQALGARDLVVGLGLITAADHGPWLRARLASDVGDAVLHAAGALSGRFRPGRSLATAGFAAAVAAAEYALLVRSEKLPERVQASDRRRIRVEQRDPR